MDVANKMLSALTATPDQPTDKPSLSHTEQLWFLQKHLKYAPRETKVAIGLTIKYNNRADSMRDSSDGIAINPAKLDEQTVSVMYEILSHTINNMRV